ncbi:MAG: gephyrin-like molybdotransferase Glp [Pseudomonadota bacterium]
MIDVDEARERLFAAVPAMPPEDVPLERAAGRVLAADVGARRDQPPFAASAMDGYAIRAADDSANGLKLIGEAAAGQRFAGKLGAGEAVRIFTGAPVPEGADTVLIQENAQALDGRVFVREAPLSGANIRQAALDFRAGQTLLAAGTVLAPRHLALAGAGGHGTLPLVRRPLVGFLATGDELVAPGEAAGPDEVVASTTAALSSLLRDAGADAADFGIVADDITKITAAAEAALAEVDILVTLGGASVGDHDLVRPALEGLGVRLDFWKVAVRPGKPLMFAARPLVLGLPGNPVSGYICAVLFLVPMIKKMLGSSEPGPQVRRGVLGAPLRQNGPRRDHLRASFVDDALVAFERQDSSMLSVLAASDALVVRMPHAAAAPAGAECDYIML